MVETRMDEYEVAQLNGVKSTIKAHGIVSIVFGAIGVAFGTLFALLIAAGQQFDTDAGTFGGSNLFVSIFSAVVIGIFWILPHIYLIVSGYYMLHNPSPRLLKGLVIANLVIGVFWNLILLVLAIINLTQLAQYTQAYKHQK